jgi:hypothetical protein
MSKNNHVFIIHEKLYTVVSELFILSIESCACTGFKSISKGCAGGFSPNDPFLYVCKGNQ